MSGAVARGLRGILTACCATESPVPFMCSTKKFQDGDKIIKIKIVNGIGQRTTKQSKKNNKNNNKSNTTKNNNQNEEEDQNLNEEEDLQENNINNKENGDEKIENQGALQEQLASMTALTGSNNTNQVEKTTEEEEKNEQIKDTNNQEEEKNEQDNNEQEEDKNEQEEEENEEEEEEKEPDFDYTFDINDRTVEGEEDTEFKEDIMTICEYIRNSVSTLFDSQVVAFQASFGAKIEGHKIWLLNGDISTTSNGFSQNLFRSVPGGEIDFIDFLIEQLSEDNKSRNDSTNKKRKYPQKTANKNQGSRPTSSQSLRSNQSENQLNEEEEESNEGPSKRKRASSSFSRNQKDNKNNEFSKRCAEYDHNLATKNWHYCYSGFPTCLNAHYRVPRIFVILYRAHQAFPNVNEARLYRTIEQRLEAIDEDASKKMVSVCIQCVHLYTAEEKTCQGQRLTNNMPKDVPTHPFASLVPAELSIKGLRDVGSTPDMYRPFCYKINCRDSPYRDPALKAKRPPEPPDRNPIQRIPKAEKWVKRLTNPYRAHSVKSLEGKKLKQRNSQKKDQFSFEELEKLPPIFPTRQSYSERLAPDSYFNQPFAYSFLGKVKKKNEMLKKRTQRLNSRVKSE